MSENPSKQNKNTICFSSNFRIVLFIHLVILIYSFSFIVANLFIPFHSSYHTYSVLKSNLFIPFHSSFNTYLFLDHSLPQTYLIIRSVSFIHLINPYHPLTQTYSFITSVLYIHLSFLFFITSNWNKYIQSFITSYWNKYTYSFTPSIAPLIRVSNQKTQTGNFLHQSPPSWKIHLSV